MTKMIRRTTVSVAALTLIAGSGLSSCSPAGEQVANGQNASAEIASAQNAGEQSGDMQSETAQNAKALLKKMSDYLAAQKVMSLAYDSVFEVVSEDHQKLQIATSGTVDLSRPDKIRTTRKAGFADTEMVFDGKTVSLLGKGMNAYVQADVPGTTDNLIDQLRDKFHRPIPGADLLVQNVYDALMEDVTDIKDLGSGIVGGVECDHLAFRSKDTDWQIWITQGKEPRPCRYVITTRDVDEAPQYTLVIREWKAGAGAADFTFKPPAGAKRLDVKDLETLKETADLPENFRKGAAK